jgi:hypothetical protein
MNDLRIHKKSDEASTSEESTSEGSSSDGTPSSSEDTDHSGDLENKSK